MKRFELAENTYRHGRRVWYVANLIERAKGLEVFDAPVRCLYTGASVWSEITSPQQMAEHMARVRDADLSCPIILSAEGFIMDGLHRVAKALHEGVTHVKAVRFDETPTCDFERDEQ